MRERSVGNEFQFLKTMDLFIYVTITNRIPPAGTDDYTS